MCIFEKIREIKRIYLYDKFNDSKKESEKNLEALENIEETLRNVRYLIDLEFSFCLPDDKLDSDNILYFDGLNVIYALDRGNGLEPQSLLNDCEFFLNDENPDYLLEFFERYLDLVRRINPNPNFKKVYSAEGQNIGVSNKDWRGDKNL